MTVVLDWFLGAELNRSRLELVQVAASTNVETAVGEAWMDLITRVTITVAGVTVDSDVGAEAGAFDWTTEKADSILRLELGRTNYVYSSFTGLPADPRQAVPARIDIYHGSDNAALSVNGQQSGGVRFRIYSE